MSHGGINSSNGPGELAVPPLAYKHGHNVIQLHNTQLILRRAMKCYFLRRAEEWECVLENTDRPKALCPDKRKGIMNLFASRWESKH